MANSSVVAHVDAEEGQRAVLSRHEDQGKAPHNRRRDGNAARSRQAVLRQTTSEEAFSGKVAERNRRVEIFWD